jgi:hypothetical protein
MEILTEIVEVSEGIITVLTENGFFEENIFIRPDKLKQSLQIKMQRKWEEQEDMLLTDKEFMEACNEEIQKSVSDTIGDLVEKGAVNMGVDETGEIVYSANKDFDQKNL